MSESRKNWWCDIKRDLWALQNVVIDFVYIQIKTLKAIQKTFWDNEEQFQGIIIA